MNKNQLNDSREEAEGEAGEAAGNNSANVDTGKNRRDTERRTEIPVEIRQPGEQLARTM